MKLPEGRLEPWVALVSVLVSIRPAQGVLIMWDGRRRGAGVTRYCNIIGLLSQYIQANFCPEGTACSTSCDATGITWDKATLFPA